MRAVGMPNGLSAVGYAEADCTTLADGAWVPSAIGDSVR